MSYTPTTWQSGDLISSEKLNKMEQGIANSGGGVLVVAADGNETRGSSGQSETQRVLNKTWQEIVDAGFAVLLSDDKAGTLICPLALYGNSGDSYDVAFTVNGSLEFYTTNSASGYPTIDSGSDN